MGRQKRTLATRYCYYPVSDLVLSRSSSNGWNDGVEDPPSPYPSHFNEFASKRRRQHNGMHREFPIVLLEKFWVSWGARFPLGHFHPPTKELKNFPVYHRPHLPRRQGAVGSRSRYCIMPSNV
jgi:hypothetical protein